MTRIPTPPPATQKPEPDDRWLSDCPDDLGQLGLLADDEAPAHPCPPAHQDEMGLMPPTHPRTHKHDRLL